MNTTIRSGQMAPPIYPILLAEACALWSSRLF